MSDLNLDSLSLGDDEGDLRLPQHPVDYQGNLSFCLCEPRSLPDYSDTNDCDDVARSVDSLVRSHRCQAKFIEATHHSSSVGLTQSGIAIFETGKLLKKLRTGLEALPWTTEATIANLKSSILLAEASENCYVSLISELKEERIKRAKLERRIEVLERKLEVNIPDRAKDTFLEPTEAFSGRLKSVRSSSVSQLSARVSAKKTVGPYVDRALLATKDANLIGRSISEENPDGDLGMARHMLQLRHALAPEDDRKILWIEQESQKMINPDYSQSGLQHPLLIGLKGTEWVRISAYEVFKNNPKDITYFLDDLHNPLPTPSGYLLPERVTHKGLYFIQMGFVGLMSGVIKDLEEQNPFCGFSFGVELEDLVHVGRVTKWRVTQSEPPEGGLQVTTADVINLCNDCKDWLPKEHSWKAANIAFLMEAIECLNWPVSMVTSV